MSVTRRSAQVYVDLDGTAHLVGLLRATPGREGERVGFTYDAGWLAHAARFALEPALTLGSGAFFPPAPRALFGAFGDSAPDRWGRLLMQRNERRRATRAQEPPRTLHEWDYLLGVHDETRQGALRFRAADGGPFLADNRTPVPPLVDLPRLIGAADRVDRDDNTDEDLALLLAPGSSLGGARPKASVRDNDGRLLIAKFSKESDTYPVVPWERVALQLAEAAGIIVPSARLMKSDGKHVLLVDRFDRRAAARVPFLSAMTMLGASDNEGGHSYPEIAEALQRQGARATADRHELWRRMVFNVLIANSDDHLRNHGFLWAGTDGWILAPAYDLNPTPRDIKPAVLSTSLVTNGDPTASVDLAMSELPLFALSRRDAEIIAGDVARAVAGWRDVARGVGLTRQAIDRMASAFEHKDLVRAASWR